MEEKERPVILLLENEENDVFFFRRALSRCEFRGDVRLVENVRQAKAYALGTGPYSDRSYYPVPDLVVSDFKMMGQTGVDFIRWLKQQADWREIPVVMYSGTALPKDREAALAAGALEFFTKSGDFQDVCDKVRKILLHLPKESR